MSNYNDFKPSGGGGVSLTWTVKNTSTTAVTGDNLLVDTTSSAITITLPASPAANDIINVNDYKGKSEINNITVARNGSNIIGLAEDFIINVDHISLSFIYVDSSTGWAVL